MYYVVCGFKTVDSEQMATLADDREHEILGQFAEETTDNDILATVIESTFSAVSARRVANTLGITRLSVHRRLEELQDGVEQEKLNP